MTGTTTALTLLVSPTPPVEYFTLPFPPPVDLFTDGATISISAAGATVPAFAGSVTAPDGIAGYSPPTAISRSAGLSVTWTAESGSFMWLLVGSRDAAGGVAAILCTVPDTGSYTIPPAALALLPASDTEAKLDIWRVGETDVAAGVSTVHLWAAHIVPAADYVAFTP